MANPFGIGGGISEEARRAPIPPDRPGDFGEPGSGSVGSGDSKWDKHGSGANEGDKVREALKEFHEVWEKRIRENEELRKMVREVVKTGTPFWKEPRRRKREINDIGKENVCFLKNIFGEWENLKEETK